MHSDIVSSNWLFDHLKDPDLVILDASEKENKSNLKTKYPDLQIVNARFFDTKNVFKDKQNPIPNMLPNPTEFEMGCRALGINNNSKIVVYDNLGVYNSPRVWWMFKVMGHNAVSVLDGGFPDWVASEFPTQALVESNVEKGNFIANFQSHLVKDSAEVLANIDSQTFTIIDARSKGRFHGTSPEPRQDLKGGHIPKSINLPFTEVIAGGKFLPKEELSLKISKLGIDDQPLVFTCGSGITACIILLATTLVNGNAKSLYDGSWSEWGQLKGVPISK